MNRIEDNESRDIVKWLSPLNFWTKQDDTFERRQEGTGEWLLDHPEFQKWVDGETKVLWCPGDRIDLILSILTSDSWSRQNCSCV